jgi:hypothetical protein
MAQFSAGIHHPKIHLVFGDGILVDDTKSLGWVSRFFAENRAVSLRRLDISIWHRLLLLLGLQPSATGSPRTNGTQSGCLGERGSKKELKSSLKVGLLAFRKPMAGANVQKQRAFH